MTNESVLWFFESENLYQILCSHKVKAMNKKHKFHFYRKNEFIYMPQTAADHIYMVADGRVRIGRYLEDGQEVIKSILTKGEIFGELAMAGEEKRTDFAQSMDENTSVCPLGIEELKALMVQDKEL